jgi:hypothetical protein
MYRYLHQLLEAQNWLRGEPGVIVNTRNTIPSKERRQLIVQKGQRCAYCSTMDNLTVDHKLARALGAPTRAATSRCCARAMQLAESG